MPAPESTVRRVLTIFVAVSVSILATTAISMESIPVPDKESEIESLIELLDAQKFNVRENATNKLVALGESAIKPVGLHFYDATPETAWRIKRILEQIATDATEELTSLKAIGVLIVLDHRWTGELSGLLATWRENRSNRALQYLISKGATTQPSGIQRQIFLNRRIFQIRDYSGSDANASASNNNKRQKGRSESEARKEIESVVDGNFDEVQEFVFDRLPNADADPEQEQLVDAQFIVRAQMGGIGIVDRNGNSKFLEIGEKWTGDSTDLKRLAEVHSLSAVRFDKQRLTKTDVETISKLQNIQHFAFVNSQLTSGSLTDLELPDSVTSFELGNLKIDKSIIDWLASHPIASLIIDDCAITSSAKAQFSDLSDLQSLDLRHVEIDRSFFRRLEKLSKMQRLNLSVCKFRAEDYRHFALGRPRVAFFKPVSFLGVQARRTSGGADTWTCQIEMVVPESGAEKAGIKEGDIIESVNGDEIQTFEELRMHISQYEIGEQMQLRVSRDGKTLKLTATLGDNPNNPVR